MTDEDDAIGRFERHLQAALDRFAHGLHRYVGDARPATSHDGSPHRTVLEAEEARLRRKARRNAPSYDLNRHIAVRRLLALLGDGPGAVRS